jgi:predicted ATPase
MIESMRFINFRVLKDATLPLRPLTVIIGPNGSGKSTALQAFDILATRISPTAEELGSVGTSLSAGQFPTIQVKVANRSEVVQLRWQEGAASSGFLAAEFYRSRVYGLNADALARPVPLQRTFEMKPDGTGLAAVLTNLQDQFPERFDALNDELHRWMPEFDRVLFDTPNTGHRAFMLRTTEGSHPIPAINVSQGTILSLALLTLAHLPNPPTLLGLEEPDRGIHPRLLRDVRDAIFHLTNPKAYGDKRDPVQVVLTTHSPYLIDLFKDQLDSIVIAEKDGLYAKFSRLSDQPHIEEILRDAHLGDAWYSGILGGVPAGT